MAISKRWLPSKADWGPVFAACVLPVFSWSIVWFFQKMPGWMPYLNIWKLLSIFAYTQAFALLESAFILLLLTTLAVILPARLFRDKFAVQGSTIVFVTTFWIILFQSTFFNVRQWALAQFLLWFGLSLVSIVIACVLVRRSRRLEKAVSALAQRLTVFLYIYIPLGLLGLIVVIIRNTV